MAGASLRHPGSGPSLLPSVWSRLPSLMSAEGRSSPCRFPDPHGVFIREEIVPTMLNARLKRPPLFGGGFPTRPRSLRASWGHSLAAGISTRGFGRIR